MKSKILLLVFVTLVFAFGFSGDKSEVMLVNNVVIMFEGTNANGNNLWLDNFSFGTRYNNDLTITSIGMKDKNYLIPGVTTKNFSPVATVLNAGRNTNSGGTITMTDQGSYTSTKTISSVAGGAATSVTFDPITFSLNSSKNMKVYINWSTDENHANDTVTQATIFLPGVQKNIVFEAHTSTTCGPCATYNPALDAFVQTHFDSIVPIKIHCWWPSIGDPMYALNIPQARVRILYNSISAIPGLMVDGVLQQISGYSQATLQPLYDSRRALASPIGLTVTDTRLAGDTIKATIVLNVVSALPSNVDYRLRINAIERKISYTTPPGSNGETTFYDVFRKQYPSINGISVNYTPGIYTIEYKYKRESAWVDSMMYTSVFIQDEYTHEIINGAKARNYYIYDKIEQPAVTDNSVEPKFSSLETNPLLTGSGIEMENMEGTIPPPGWSIINTDSNFTFWQYVYAAIGGPSFPGVKAIRMSYYSYVENVGTKDYLKSKVYNNVNVGDSIKFDYAYAQRAPYEDRLVVKVSVDGGNTFPFIIFDKQGANLGTTAPSSSSFVPTAGQWGTFAGRFGSLVGVEPFGNITPEKFELMQNYPNPFNPATTIKYNISKNSYVTLKVYDILGKEVATLVNRSLKAGQYELQFNAGNLTSGVYFYKIIAGNFTDIKKMLVVK